MWHLLNKCHYYYYHYYFLNLVSSHFVISSNPFSSHPEEFQLQYSLHYYPISKDGGAPSLVRPLAQISIAQCTGRGRVLIKPVDTHPLLPPNPGARLRGNNQNCLKIYSAPRSCSATCRQ